MDSLLASAIEEVTQDLGVQSDEVHQAMGEQLLETIRHMEPAQITDLFSSVEEDIFNIQINGHVSERQLSDEGLQALKKYLLDFRRTIDVDRNYMMKLTQMIGTLNLRQAMTGMQGYNGISQSGPSLDELQRITDGFLRNETPLVDFAGTDISTVDDDNPLDAALNKHFNT